MHLVFLEIIYIDKRCVFHWCYLIFPVCASCNHTLMFWDHISWTWYKLAFHYGYQGNQFKWYLFCWVMSPSALRSSFCWNELLWLKNSSLVCVETTLQYLQYIVCMQRVWICASSTVWFCNSQVMLMYWVCHKERIQFSEALKTLENLNLMV